MSTTKNYSKNLITTNVNEEYFSKKDEVAVQSKNTSKTLKRKVICFSDFDGTIFLQDTGHILFDAHGCGPTRRATLEAQIASGERSFRDVSEEMWASLRVPFDDGFALMKSSLDIDPHFKSFHQYCLAHDIPFNIISAGLKPVLRKVLDAFLGEEESGHISIVANEAIISEGGSKWKPIWRHDNELGHNKAVSVQEAREQAKLTCEDGTIPLIVFIGDGISDLPAAREADVLFARRGLKLESYCIEHQIPFIAFDTFADIQREVQKIREEDERETSGRGVPVRFNPRANLWRRVSSKNSVPQFLAGTLSNEEKIILMPEEISEYKPKMTVDKGIAA
ncbi:Bgt-1008 [Blumeria graminis f. sp. tritici]|uniref:Bgt-1008 n=2 Tax=Blumeria graminis f. sp. tritici TaxID=62690 RepID=A0A061HPR8_BLUGR|nr:hypothetical protein BGT96224_1008 [Blumeria graminis f. sp. tritici 96224]VCU41378.1 Bgt-1008 [Blumeria graminis f. sp. tritici]